jgi:hypothetical protein
VVAEAPGDMRGREEAPSASGTGTGAYESCVLVALATELLLLPEPVLSVAGRNNVSDNTLFSGCGKSPIFTSNLLKKENVNISYRFVSHDRFFIYACMHV